MSTVDLDAAQGGMQHMALIIAEFYATLIREGIPEATAAALTMETTKHLYAQVQSQSNPANILTALLNQQRRPT